MLKSGISKKHSKASGLLNLLVLKQQSKLSLHPLPQSIIGLCLKIIQHIMRRFVWWSSYSHLIHSMVHSTHSLTLFLYLLCSNVPSLLFRLSHNLHEVHLNLIDDSHVVLTKTKFLEAINLRVLTSTKFYSTSPNDFISTLLQMGYQMKIRGISEFKKNQLLRCGSSCATSSSGVFPAEPTEQTTWESNFSK